MKKPDIIEMEVTVRKQSEQLYNNKLLLFLVQEAQSK